jgi:DNA-binding SARP family transcriptional activator/tetratricopeptide (TPR) repeat protein
MTDPGRRTTMEDVEPMPSKVGGLRFGLLGPLEVWASGRPLAVRSPKLRILLAALLLGDNQPVPIRGLVDAIWGAHQPENPRRTVQLCVARLRTIIGTPLIRTSADGYRIDVEPEQLDIGRFATWIRRADRAAERGDPEKESQALREALAQWRGEPLVDVPSELLQRETVPALREQRLLALERRIEVDLRLGRHNELVRELMELTAQQPLRERLWAQLMTALHRSGRRAEALAAYHTGRRHLADELGIDPGEELRKLHGTILAGQPEHRAPGAVTVPRQLPPEPSGFAGRVPEVARLDALLVEHESRQDRSPAVVVISGTAGVGKTALALHWSRRVADRFPDGQLWVDLRAYDHRPAVTPEHALTLFLRALGVDGPAIPRDVDSQAGLFRSLMDGRRMLIVVDNASSPEQVHTLLPGGLGSLVVVTSRSQLAGLVVADGAYTVVLDLFTTEEARHLLARRIGRERVRAEPEATEEIIARCARLPLALAVVAARAAMNPTVKLAALAQQLRDTGSRLDEFTWPGAATDVRAVFSWSYEALSRPAARLFRLMSLHPGPDLSATAAANLTGRPAAEVRPLLAELTHAHLVVEHDLGRYSLHDLLRVYASELADLHDPVNDRHAAERRLLDQYLQTAHAAALLIDPLHEPIRIEKSTLDIEPVRSREEALAWFNVEYSALLGLIEIAHRDGFDAHTWQLTWALEDVQKRRGQWRDRATVLHASLDATRRLGNVAEEARVRRGLGHVYTWMSRLDDALRHLHAALALYTDLSDWSGQADVLLVQSWVLERQGNHPAALEHARQALGVYPASGYEWQRARALNAIGCSHIALGENQQAVEVCTRALEMLGDSGDEALEAATWDTLGQAHHRLGDPVRAVECYLTALRLRFAIDHRRGQANTLARLADAYVATGDPASARETLQEALAIFEQLNEPEARAVRVRLAALTGDDARV